MAPVAKATRKVYGVGAPSQPSQPSRKGKRAWRKHVDITKVEQTLEDIRTEERIIGTPLQKRTNVELFQVDVTGDSSVRKLLPRFKSSQLTSAKIIAQRSAVPALQSRKVVPKRGKSGISREEKVRLLKVGRRKQLGPLNAVMDPTELGSGTALLEPTRAVNESGKYDIWGQPEEVIRGVNDTDENRQFVAPVLKPPPPKQPQTSNPRAAIKVPAVTVPHQGTSYNPPLQSHQDLLLVAYDKAHREEQETERLAGIKKAVETAQKFTREEYEGGAALGMNVDKLENSEEDVFEDDGSATSTTPNTPNTSRKTKKQREKAKKLRLERRAAEEDLKKKRMLTTISAAKSIRKALRKKIAESEEAKTKKHLDLQEKMKSSGLVGMRVGKHLVEDVPMDVQLGEELSESFRAMKPEGNLFRDRFLSLQQRALVEPRVRVIPKKHKAKTKDVEKFAWKRFE